MNAGRVQPDAPFAADIRQLRSKRSRLRGSCTGFRNSQNIQTNAAPRQTTVPRNIRVIWGTVIIMVMAWSRQLTYFRSCARRNARRSLWSVLRLSVTERPVFLLYLDKTDERVLRPEIQMLMQSHRHGLVEGALLIDRSALVQSQLNNHAVL